MTNNLYLAAALLATLSLSAETPRASIAVEADALAYGLPGYSAIVNVSLRNKLQFAAGTGRYDVPAFLLKGDSHYNDVKWKATATSLQVYRVGYRFKGPMKNGPVLGAIVMNQNWRLRAEKLTGETRFRPLSTGVTGGSTSTSENTSTSIPPLPTPTTLSSPASPRSRASTTKSKNTDPSAPSTSVGSGACNRPAQAD